MKSLQIQEIELKGRKKKDFDDQVEELLLEEGITVDRNQTSSDSSEKFHQDSKSQNQMEEGHYQRETNQSLIWYLKSLMEIQQETQISIQPP